MFRLSAQNGRGRFGSPLASGPCHPDSCGGVGPSDPADLFNLAHRHGEVGMIPTEIRYALWELMEQIEKSNGLPDEDLSHLRDLYSACSRMGEYILAQQRAQTKEA